MKKSEILLRLIDSFYTTKHTRDELLVNHSNVILKYTNFWNDTKYATPKNNEQVFAIQDLTSISKGKFVSNYYYYNRYGFVANKLDTDGYGFITHWITFATLDIIL